MSKVIKDDRHAGYVKHGVRDMLKQRIYGIAAGYEDINDHDQLCHDMAFQTAVGREVKLASGSTLSRFENNIDKEAVVEINKLFVEQFIASHKTPPKELILDFDPTDFTLYGQQEHRHYHGYYRDYCYLPMYVFCGEHLLVAMLRQSNLDGSKYGGAILKLLVKRLRQVWPEVNIIFRGDGAFARKRILSWCERNDVSYVVGMSSNNRLQQKTQDITLQAKLQFQKTHEKQRLFSCFRYAAGSWSADRRIIAKAEHHARGENLRFIVTNLPNDAQAIYDDIYCLRGDMENCIKQQKDLFADRVSCQDFITNQFRVLLSAAAYVLLSALRRRSLIGARFEKLYCRTLCIKLIKIGAVVLKNTRRIQFLLPTHHPYQKEFGVAAGNLAPT
jgi:hypothetical protein